MTQDLKMTGADYNIALSVFFIPVCLAYTMRRSPFVHLDGPPVTDMSLAL